MLMAEPEDSGAALKKIPGFKPENRQRN